ncbi:HNH endonuclease [Demequina maris]|uniref:HNH endonuclease n=1 Tax=Demequina maris TaxID=1638982 RepID=UPI000782D6D0|nr:HNH endonuclease [Demequina maris]
MVAAMLLLPDPRREYGQTNSALPVARAKGYVLSRIGFGPDTEFAGVTDLVTIDPSFVTLASLAGEDSVGVRQRWLRIQAVYGAVATLPPLLAKLLDEHRAYLESGAPVTSELSRVVANLVKAVDPVNGGDPLPQLEALAHVVVPPDPTLPPPDEIGEEDPDVAIRSAIEYRMSKARGSAAKKFSDDVRAAYHDRCAFCGGRFGGLPGVRSGVDAAHILAWHRYELDVVPNGLCLCKLHHWAFDAAIILPVYRAGLLHMSFTELADGLDAPSRALLGDDGAPIPLAHMPSSRAQWPSEKYLAHLYADLGFAPN